MYCSSVISCSQQIVGQLLNYYVARSGKKANIMVTATIHHMCENYCPVSLTQCFACVYGKIFSSLQ